MSIVRIGCFDGSSGVSTHGTGFIIKYDDKYYLITCRHVIHKCSTDSFFMLINTTNQPIPSNIDLYLRLGTPIFDKADTNDSSTDIVVFELSKTMIRKHKLESFKLEAFDNYDDVRMSVAIGYPNEYISSKSSLVIEKLEPYRTRCQYSDAYDLSNLELENFPFNVNVIKGAILEEVDFKSYSGISGGVLVDDESGQILGVISFAGISTVSIEGETVSAFGIIPKALIKKIIDKV